MKREEFEAQQQAIPDDKLVEMAQNALSKLCETGGRSLTMTVPPRVDDTDMIISELIRRFKDKQPLPPADGAEEVIRKYCHTCFSRSTGQEEVWSSLESVIIAVHDFATLHAQKIAEKMVSERMREELITYVKWYGSFSYENLTDEMLVDEYLKSKEQ